MPPSLSYQGRNPRNASGGSPAARGVVLRQRRLAGAAGGTGRRGLSRRAGAPGTRSRDMSAANGAVSGEGAQARDPSDPGQDPLPARPELAQALARDDDADGRAFARLALHFAEPSQESDALAHSEQTEVPRANPGFAPLLGLEAVAVIADIDLEGLFVLEEREADFVRGRVLLDVVERLHRHAIEGRLGLA